MTAPRWTVDDDGTPCWQDGHGHLWPVSPRGWFTRDGMTMPVAIAARDGLVAAVRDADTLAQARQFAVKAREAAIVGAGAAGRSTLAELLDLLLKDDR